MCYSTDGIQSRAEAGFDDHQRASIGPADTFDVLCISERKQKMA